MSPLRVLRGVVVVAAVVALAACGPSPQQPAAHSSSARGSSPAEDRVRVQVGRGPKDVTYAVGSLWVTNFDDNTVSRVDPAAARVTATIPVGHGPITAVATGDTIWVANYLGGTVSRIDPVTDTVTATVVAGGKPVGLTAHGTDLWVFNQADATATVVDARTAAPIATVATGVHAGWSTAFNGRIWVCDFQGSTRQVVAIDPVLRAVVARVPTGPAPILAAFADGSGWVANTGDASVTRFDPADGRVQATVAVPGGAIGPLLATPTAVWVSVYGGAGVARIDPSTNAVASTVPVGVHPQKMIVVGAALWLVEDGENDIVVVPQP